MTGDVLDLGSGVTVNWYVYRDIDPAGIYITHRRPDNGERCIGAVLFDTPEVREAFPGRDLWTVESLDPLTLSPSMLCSCNHHGFIIDGRWVPA